MPSKLREKTADFKALSVRDKLLLLFPYFLAILLCCRTAELYRLCNGNYIRILKNMEYLYKSVPSFSITDILFGVPAGYFIIWYIKYENARNRKKMRKGVEYGSGEWGTPKDIKPFIDPDPFNNIILSKTEMLSIAPKMKLFELNRNKNVIVYGSSGSGKTFSFVKPNMMQLHSSLVVTDPNGLVC
ncbi:MAG: type IV secretory system conjugative DNA transfer family protein [Lachnospiraceae bacterium]|nr:type IV secretory system conjugative DNA transfer family protein [Lachnospiraceae bacterium]